MKREYNELVGLQATFSKVIQRYSISHFYRWRCNGQVAETGTMRGFDLHRHIPVVELLENLFQAYAPAILSIWRQVTDSSDTVFLQFEAGARPEQVGLPGPWEHWAEL